MWHGDSTVITGNAFTIADNGTYWYSTQIYQNPSQVNDTFAQSFMLASGNYTLKVWGYQDTKKATPPVVSWYVDTVFQGTTNLVGASQPAIAVLVVKVSTNGLHTLTGVVTSTVGTYDNMLARYTLISGGG